MLEWVKVGLRDVLLRLRHAKEILHGVITNVSFRA